MGHRSSELQEHIEELGGNLNVFYQQRESQTRVWSDIYDLDRFALPESPSSEAESTVDSMEVLPTDPPHGTSTYLHYLCGRPDFQNPPAVQFDSNVQDGQEEYESEIGDLLEPPESSTRAGSDPIVQRYAERPDPPPHSFPSFFLRTIPFSVLKALYYVNNFHPDRSHLVMEYKIPPSIQTVMTYARYDQNFDGFNHSCWPSLDLHPAIRKALYLG
jgi:hypothetical protein